MHDAADIQRIYLWLGTSLVEGKPMVVPAIAGTVWSENNKTADQYNKPGKFTAFCSYEWTSNGDFRNMHRNVFFRDCAKVPQLPFSSLDSAHPEDLWKWMDGQRKAGNELLAISHNANLSDGHMYPIDVDSYGRPIDAAGAQSRDRNERLIEIKQIKGPRKPTRRSRPTMNSPTTRSCPICSATRRGVSTISSAATRARLSKMASPRCSTELRATVDGAGARRPSSGRWHTGSQTRSVATTTMRSTSGSGAS